MTIRVEDGKVVEDTTQEFERFDAERHLAKLNHRKTRLEQQLANHQTEIDRLTAEISEWEGAIRQIPEPPAPAPDPITTTPGLVEGSNLPGE